MSKSKQYWLDRMLARDKAAKLSEDKLLEELNRYYTDSYIAIEKELNNFYVKYATENGLSYNQARKILTPKDIKEYSSKIRELKKIYEETKDMNVYLKMQEIGSRANVTRLQSLLDSIDIELIKSAHNTQISIEQHLSNMYKRSYKQALEDIGASNKAINSRAVKEALSYPWSGRNFSERIWGNNTKIFNTMQETITRGIIQGKSVPNVSKDIKGLSKQVFKKEKTLRELEKIHRYNAERLVRTETNHFMTKGHIEGYKASGVVKAVEICVHWDERTCPDCESMDREVIPLNEVSYGSNVPPFHPLCRCTVVPVVDNNEKTGYNYNEDGTIVVTHDWKGEHVSIPRELEPYAVLETDTKYRDGYYQIDRTLYDENKKMHIQIHSGHHDRPDKHPYGENGEHKHIYTWHEDKPKPDRTSEELNDEDRNQNKDIIRKGGK